MKPLFLYVLIVCVALMACKKDPLSPLEQLPPITSTGANTFGCLINGEAVVFTNPKQISYGLIGDYDSLGPLPVDSSDIWLVFENENHVVNIFLNNPLSNKSWQLDKKAFLYPGFSIPIDYIMIDNMMTSNYTKGFFESNDLNKTWPTFSGIFEFECLSPKNCNTLKVTNGRLDVDLRKLQ